MARPPPPSKTRRQLFVVAAGVTAVMAIVAVWVGVHKVPWLGPRLHEIGTAIFGRTAMGWVERLAYAADDGWNRLWEIDERPEAYWNLPASSASAAGSTAAPPAEHWVPPGPGPMVHTPFSKNDGLWFPIVEAPDGTGGLAFRLVLHPDGDRADATVKVVAVDLKRSTTGVAAGRALDRKGGLVPTGLRGRLVLVVAGGRKAARNARGLAMEGAVLRRPKPSSCFVGQAGGAGTRVGFWTAAMAKPEAADWWLQGPPCVLDGGELQLGTHDDGPLKGRRALIGVSRDGALLLAGVAEAVDAEAGARAMRHAGAWSAMVLDSGQGKANVLSFPSANGTTPARLFDEADPGPDYVERPSEADFVYVVRKGE